MEASVPALHEQLAPSHSAEVKALIAQDKVGWPRPEGPIAPEVTLSYRGSATAESVIDLAFE